MTGLLSKAVTNLNNRVRNQNLSSAQIHFSRDTIAGHNLHLNDKNLMKEKLVKRKENYPEARLKAPMVKKPNQAKVSPGKILYAQDSLSKHEVRDPLLVTGVQGTKVRVKKVLNSNENSDKTPKISSEKVTVDKKFLYIPPHRRQGVSLHFNSDDSVITL